jgi:hypothetical protein
VLRLCSLLLGGDPRCDRVRVVRRRRAARRREGADAEAEDAEDGHREQNVQAKLRRHCRFYRHLAAVS